MKNTIYLIIGLLISTFSTFGQGTRITGKVVDISNETIIGAIIQVKGTDSRTITDVKGNFSVTSPSATATLVVSYMGMQKQEIKIGEHTTGITVILKEDSKLLNEVVVVGFGTQKKINATGAVKTIDAKVLESRPISNAIQGLQGLIAGVNISNDNGGGLGQSMNINIRGIGSIGEGSVSSPLIMIDGIEGDLSTINPSDIENISVLKDAAAASIYGSRAPFGVILVTTKSGVAQKTQFTYTGNVRVSTPISVPKPVDSYTYALMVNDAYTNSGGNPQFSSSFLEKIQKYQRGELPYGIDKVEGLNDWGWNQRSYGNSNWYDIHLNDFTYSQEHNLSARGGNSTTNYFISANYLDQNGLFTFANEKYDRLTVSGKFNIKLTNKLTLNWSSRLVNTTNDKPTALNNLFFHNLGRRSPLMPEYMPNGDYNKESLIPSLLNGGRNMVKNKLFYNQAQFTYEPLKKWKIYLDLGSRIEKSNDTRQFNKISYMLPDGTQNYFAVLEGVVDKPKVNPDGSFARQPNAGVSYYERANGGVNYFNTSFRSDYEIKVDQHNLKFLVGMQTEYFYSEKVRVSSDNIASDETPFLPDGAGSNQQMSERKGEWANLGIFGRINYNYADRYMLELNLRKDAASRFPSNQRWGQFPSISAGWNIAQEKFWEKLYEKGFEMVKFRGSYGVLGNQNTTSFYQYYQKMSTGPGDYIIGGAKTTFLPGPEPFSTSLTWEKIETIDVGIDIGILSNRLSATFDVYQRNSRDMIGPSKSLPSIYGAIVPKTNNAELKTNGWEAEISWRDRIGKDISYFATATLSDNQTVVTKYDSPDGALNGYFIGKNPGDIWGYQVQGIAKSDKEMEDWLSHVSQSTLGKNWGGGDIMYKDIDGSGSVNNGGNSTYDHGDLTVIGNSTPRYAFGLNLGMTWKFIDFSMFIQGIGKRDLYFTNSATFFGFAGEWQRSLYYDHLDYFRYAGEPLGANMDSYYGRLRTDQNNIQVCDRFVQNGAYVRLKNLQIGISLPKTATLSKYIQKARFYVSGENLLTFTKLRIYDPEAVGSVSGEYGAGKTYPMYQVFSAGVEITL